jgi:hypothetical protein
MEESKNRSLVIIGHSLIAHDTDCHQFFLLDD